MADDNREVLAGINQLRQKIEAMTNKLGGTISTYGGKKSSTQSTTDELGKAAKSLTKETKTRAELIEELNNTDKQYLSSSTKKVVQNKKYTDLLNRISNSLQSVDSGLQSQREELYEAISSSKSSRAAQERYIDLYSKSVQSTASSLGQNIKKSSLLGSALLRSSSAIEEGSAEYHKLIENLYESTKPLGENLLRYANAWDESANAVKSGLTKSDFAEINLKIGNAAAELADSMRGLEGTGFESLDVLLGKSNEELVSLFTGASDVNSAAGKLKTAMISAALGLEKSGLNVGAGLLFGANGEKLGDVNASKLSELGKAGQTIDGKMTAEGRAAAEELVSILKNVGNANAKVSATQKSFASNATMASSELGKLNLQYQDARKSNGKFIASVKTAPKAFALLSAAVGQITDTIMKFAPAYNTVMDFNTAYVPMSFADTQMQAVKLGMSFESTTKYLQDNKNVMALYGEQFGDLQAKTVESFQKFGLTMEQGAPMVSNSIATAIASGINVKDSNALNKSLQNTLQNFTKLAGVLDITGEQYSAMNKDLFTSSDIQAALLGLDNAKTSQMAKSLELDRNEYAIRMNSVQAAQELIKLQQRQGREKIMERTRAGAFAMLAAQQAGMNPADAARVFQIAQKTGSRRSDGENRFLANAMATIRLSQEQQVAGAGSEGAALMAEVFIENVRPLMGTLDSVAEIQQGYLANLKAGAIPTSGMLNAASAAAAPNLAVAEVGQTINQITSVLNNTFLKSIIGGSVAMVGLTISAIAAARSLMGVGMSGGLGGFGGGAGKAGKGGKFGRLARGAGGLLKGGVAGILGGFALDYASDKLTDAGHEKSGAVASIGSSAVSGAGLGAMIGSVVPVVGTALGAAVGGALGGAYGLYKNWGTLSGESDMSKKALNVGTSQGMVSLGNSANQAIFTASATPIIGPGQSAGISAAPGINNISVLAADSSSKPDKNLAVIDTTAHNYLAELSKNMQAAVILLQQIASMAPSEQAALATKTMNPIIPAASYYQGRT